jgi:ABC-type lipoprotein export system ATPase subunit
MCISEPDPGRRSWQVVPKESIVTYSAVNGPQKDARASRDATVDTMEMAPTNSPHSRGAQWRKWDLHVHSPASENFSGDWPGFIIQLGNSDCAVIGINDYFSVAGYKQLLAKLADPLEAANGNKAYREALAKLKDKTLLPVVECRMTNVVLGKKNTTGQRINFHIIFSSNVSPDDIETFIKSLKVKDQSIGGRYSDPKFLLDEAQADFKKVLEQLHGDNTFKGKFLVWIPYDEYGGIDTIDPKTDKLLKEGLVFDADILGSGNKKQADFFLWKDTAYSEADYKKWFGKRKPCIKGSDSHNANDEIGRLKDHNSKPTDRYCWIKADPTFIGLQQIVNEPEDRVFIGALPPKLERVKDNKTFFLSRVKIGKVDNGQTADAWFDCDIELNHDMIAIIGNKGSGKSALADIIALAGDTARYADFSFLDKKKFRERKLAANFKVTATWEDRTETVHNLQNDPDPSRPETIRYIPQTYLETVCTETSADEGSAFQHELRKVIFSHITDAQRLGKETLDTLIAYKTEEINAELARHKQELSQINLDIAALQQKETPNFRRQIEEARNEKIKELQAHQTNKPPEVPKPDNLTDEQKETYSKVADEMATLNSQLTASEEQISRARQEQRLLIEKAAIVAKLESKLSNIESDLKAQVQISAPQFAALGLDVAKIIIVTIDRSPLDAKKAEIAISKAAADKTLSADDPNSLLNQQKAIGEKIAVLKDQLDAPNKRYQTYLQQLRAWDARKKEIEGTTDLPGSLLYLAEQLEYLDKKLPDELELAKAHRYRVALEVHKCISAIRNVYAELFAPVQTLIENSIIIKEGFKLSFVSSIVQRGFGRELFDRHVSQGVNGSFCGKEAGEQRLGELFEDCDFNAPAQALAFAQAIEDHLNFDHRSAKKPPMDIGGQLRKHASVSGLYDFLWSFEYLIPEYSLKLDGKDLTQLSPGERGALLLVFYLLVDKSDRPIIVDQPEENLDNQTVYHLLIPVIRTVKKRRQIIMVTHNPNIAVVCDAEQIIYASIDRANGNRITYASGSIEDPVINKHLLDVLEGTRPAFDNRDAKYQV